MLLLKGVKNQQKSNFFLFQLFLYDNYFGINVEAINAVIIMFSDGFD
jgi:hypothetical protein